MTCLFLKAVCLFKELKAFEASISNDPSESACWNIYAQCVWQLHTFPRAFHRNVQSVQLLQNLPVGTFMHRMYGIFTPFLVPCTEMYRGYSFLNIEANNLMMSLLITWCIILLIPIWWILGLLLRAISWLANKG